MSASACAQPAARRRSPAAMRPQWRHPAQLRGLERMRQPVPTTSLPHRRGQGPATVPGAVRARGSRHRPRHVPPDRPAPRHDGRPTRRGRGSGAAGRGRRHRQCPLGRRRARRTRPAHRQTRRRRGEHERAGRHRTRLVRRERRPRRRRRPRRGHRRCGRPLLLQRLQEDHPPRRPRGGGSTRAEAEALGIRLATPNEFAALVAEHLDQTATKECSPARPDGPGPAGTPACCRQRRGTRGQSSFLAFSLGRNLWRAQRHSSAVPPASSGTGSRASGASTYPSAVAVHTVRGTNAAAPSIPHRSAG